MTTSTFRRSSNSAPTVAIACTGRRHGDLHPHRVSPPLLTDRLRSVADLPWTMLDQSHGNEVVRIEHPGDGWGTPADGAITDIDDAVLAVWVGDCAPICLVGAEREFAVVHAGWRGLAAGIIDRAVDSFREPVEFAVLGPTIGPCCYEFGRVEAELVARGVNADVDRITASIGGGDTSHVALDVSAAVAAALGRHAIPVRTAGTCTGCDPAYFSHRVRGEAERHGFAAWQTAS